MAAAAAPIGAASERSSAVAGVHGLPLGVPARSRRRRVGGFPVRRGSCWQRRLAAAEQRSLGGGVEACRRSGGPSAAWRRQLTTVAVRRAVEERRRISAA